MFKPPPPRSEAPGTSNGHILKKIFFAGALATFILAACLIRLVPNSYILCSKVRSIYTVDENNPRVECISVRDSQIVGVGNFDDLQGIYHTRILSYLLSNSPAKFLIPIPRIFQLNDEAIVVPGLADAHAHIVENGFVSKLPLAGSKSIQEVVDRIKEYLEFHPDIRRNESQWIEGFGWDQTEWPGAEFPKAIDLDADPLLKGRLISLHRIDGHAGWVSPAVLELIPDIPDEVEGGLIVRDENGKPTGVFVDKAMDLIPTPPLSGAQVAEFANMTIRAALSYGLTSIHDADMVVEYLDFFKSLADNGELPIRLYVMLKGSGEYWGDRMVPLKNYGKQGRLNFRSVKLYADGALGSWGAALLKPYSDRPDTSGLLLNSEPSLREQIRRFWQDGWQTGVHCIGDHANQIVLNIYEEMLEKERVNVSEWRPRIEHAQIFDPNDLVRIGKLGVIASVQPTHATSDMHYAESRLGTDRIKGAYAYQTLLQASPQKVLPLGSDFPIEGVNPLLGFYAAVTRLSVNGDSPHGPNGWFAEEKLSREQALKGMTLDSAFAAFAEQEIGSLSPGKKADFVVLDKDIMTLPAEEILTTKVVATVIDGTVVFGDLTRF